VLLMKFENETRCSNLKFKSCGCTFKGL
jgi:hypothetical protein